MPGSAALLTDFYQLTMLNGYFTYGLSDTAVFELFVRKLPSTRAFLVAAGLEQVLSFLETLRLSSAELEYLAGTGRFPRDFIEFLAGLTFTGDVDAVKEGTIIFQDEPVVRISAPLPEAQLVESRVMNLVHLETVIASKAARSVLVAPGKVLVDFGLRRAHGFEAGLLSARASYIAGFSGTSTVLAAMRYGVPLFGTMAHSFVQAHDDEVSAFANFARTNRQNSVLLIDTYDTEKAAEKVVGLAPRLSKEGICIAGVRIDSGDLGEHARAVRRILDNGGLGDVKIFASGGLDEWDLRDLIASGAPIDGFGVGTKMNTSADAPFFDCAYKLVEYAGAPRRKRSEGKATWPGRKQVYRRFSGDGTMAFDTITLTSDASDVATGEPLLEPVMRGGHTLSRPESLADIRKRAQQGLAALPTHLRTLEPSPPYRVEIAPSVTELARQFDESRS
jgi:nicotinate phosphoribosyltransferase